ncbi:MAG: CoA pyrophosphatase [Alphaproteobacteria bacterium]|nr:CoA pyrophosphatase [Alphaproteobacteria bacterium]
MNPDPVTLSPARIRERLRMAQGELGWRGSGHLTRVRGDHDLNPDIMPKGPLKLASVLVPLVVRPDNVTVLLTKRTAHLQAHAGQISFPGGGIEEGDSDAVACALRETEEEIGLTRERVEVVGRLDTYVVRTGFQVTPVVGLVTPPFELQRDEFEVAEVFEVPLSFVLDRRNHERRMREDFGGLKREFWVMPYHEYYIWGATAGMLVNLCEVLHDAS